MAGPSVARGIGRVGEVVTLPVRRGAEAAASGVRAVADWSPDEVDDWGRDPDFVGRMWALSRLRWTVTVGGDQHLPKRAGALVVVNTRRFALAPLYAALAIGAAVDRPVRFVGRPDVAPVGPLVQRLGGLLTRTDELENVLRAGELVVLGAEPARHPRHVGRVDHRLVGAAVAAKVRVFPATTGSSPFRRGARVEIGAALQPSRRRRGPLAELELADSLESHIQRQLDELGGTLTGTPLDWLPLSGMGGQ
jgi:hypothetical protein